ncbi:Max-binding protein MNT [Eumeta japonica]|uniref:Max-binding protein MNT n=1 Tax=Eumeta variegata TaxID=151549 RepID=A0A4C1THR6_EUMVA|nr:Max-binding protein MNT [Eumeta japonica]
MNVLPVSRLRIANIAQITNETPEQRQQRPDVINERVRTQLPSRRTQRLAAVREGAPPFPHSLRYRSAVRRRVPPPRRAPAPRSTTVRDTVRVRSLLDKGASATRVCPLPKHSLLLWPSSIPSPPSVSSNSSGNGNGSSSGSGSGSAPRAGTREVHNKLEKNRRAHLKECFELLKRQLPATPDDKKTSNLSILGSAIRYIQVVRLLDADRSELLLVRDPQTGRQTRAFTRYDSMNALRKTKSDFDRVIPAAITEPCAHATFMTECSMASFI